MNPTRMAGIAATLLASLASSFVESGCTKEPPPIAQPKPSATASAASTSGSASASARWMGVFSPYPRARLACDQHDLGASWEESWKTWATDDAPEVVVAFYREAHPTLVVATSGTFTLFGEGAELTVRSAKDGLGCKAAAPGDASVITITRRFGSPP